MKCLYEMENMPPEVDATILGGKGYNILRLAKYGFKVPETIILSTHAYKEFIDYNNLNPMINSSSSGIEANDLGASIINGDFPPRLISELKELLKRVGLLGQPLVVRSSASLEDSANASFAGIHDSFLNIQSFDEVLMSIKKCYASLWSTRAISYRLKMNISNEEVRQAVVIMELIEAHSSGVAFSCDPLSGRPDTIVINANFGLGEALVSGIIEPDQYTLGKDGLTPLIREKRLGKKEGQTRAVPTGGTQFVKSVEQASLQVLSNENILKLGRLVQRVFDACGESIDHQDIEWVYDGNEFILVQARPVTKLPSYTYKQLKAQPDVWSNANIKDAMPMVQTIFGWQSLKLFSEAILSTPLKLVGYKSLEGIEYTRLFNGRGYFNLSVMQWEFFDGFGVIPKETNEMLGGHQPEIKVPQVSEMQKIRKLKRLIKLLKETFKAQSNADRAFARVTSFSEEFIKKDLSSLSDYQLTEEFQTILKEGLIFTKTVALVANLAGTSFNILSKVLEKDFPNKGNATCNRLLMGQGKITSAEHGYRLMELSEMISKDKAALQFFTSVTFQPLEWEDKLPGNSPFRKAFTQFLNEYGHRGIYEGDMSNPRWREDPSYLLNYVRGMINHADFDKIKASQKVASKKAWKEIMEQVPFYRRGIIKWLVKKAIRNSEMREMAKSQLVRAGEPARKIALEIGNRFVRKGLLTVPAHIFHCSWTEAISILCGDWDGGGLSTIVEERRDKMEQYKQLTAPDTIIDGNIQVTATQDIEAFGKCISGLGVATGRAGGLVRVVLHPDEGENLNYGEILVAPSTDPAWTPLFLKASAVVMETGGFLSHGAIVSREYGIPAVVNLAGATKMLKDGDHIVVDGDEGKVYIEKGSQEG